MLSATTATSDYSGRRHCAVFSYLYSAFLSEIWTVPQCGAKNISIYLPTWLGNDHRVIRVNNIQAKNCYSAHEQTVNKPFKKHGIVPSHTLPVLPCLETNWLVKCDSILICHKSLVCALVEWNPFPFLVLMKRLMHGWSNFTFHRRIMQGQGTRHGYWRKGFPATFKSNRWIIMYLLKKESLRYMSQGEIKW